MEEINTKKVLVIEDEQPMREAIEDTLKQHGFTVFTSSDGQDGLQIGLKERPNLILLDIFMPKMDGLTMLKQLRGDVWGKDVPVVVLTNLNPDTDQAIKAILEHKPAFYLIKSNVTLEEIVGKIKEVLNI